MSKIKNKESNLISVNCKYCEKEKMVKKSKHKEDKNYFCDRNHFNLYRSKQNSKIKKCKQCNEGFEILSGEIKDFCTTNCEEEYCKTHKFEIKICKHCNKEFKVFNAGSKNKKYCSLECKREFNKNKNTKTLICEYCGKKFNTIHNSRFCSTSCSSKHFAPITGFGSKIRPKEVWNKDLKNCFNEETRQKISDKITLSIVEGRKNKDNWAGAGYRDDLGHYLRSKWEANFARIILHNGLTYEFEKKRFKLSNGTHYIPDFYIVEDDQYYEIKGYFHEDAKQKMELFKKEYPNIKLTLIKHEEYNKLTKLYKHLINNWES